MLKLFPWPKIVPPRRYRRLVSDTVPPTKSRQGRIRQIHARRLQLLMDSHEIPFAALEKLQDLLSIRFGFLRTL